MKDFIRNILQDEFKEHPVFNTDALFEKSPLLQYLDLKLELNIPFAVGM
jgi:hypothetical protein